MADFTCFDMTPSTREAAKDRRPVVQGVEMQAPTMAAMGLGIGLGLVATVVLVPVLGQLAPLVFLVTIPGSLWLVIGRSARGMRQYNWQLAADWARRGGQSTTGRFMQSGQPVTPVGQQLRMLRATGLPVAPEAQRELGVDDLLA